MLAVWLSGCLAVWLSLAVVWLKLGGCLAAGWLSGLVAGGCPAVAGGCLAAAQGVGACLMVWVGSVGASVCRLKENSRKTNHKRAFSY